MYVCLKANQIHEKIWKAWKIVGINLEKKILKTEKQVKYQRI